MSHLLVHVVITQPEVVQLVPLSARSHSPAPVTHPGFEVTVADTTALVAKAELLVRTVSQEFEMVPVNVTVVPLAASVGITGTLIVSVPRVTIAVVFVQVTVAPTWAPQDQPLSENALAGPVILAGIVSTVV